MSDAKLVAALKQRDICVLPIYAWQCWCTDCTTDIVKTYREEANKLPVAIYRKVATVDAGE